MNAVPHIGKSQKKIFPYDRVRDFTYDELISLLEGAEFTLEEVENLFSNIDPEVIFVVKVLKAKSAEERNILIDDHSKQTTISTTYLDGRRLTLSHNSILQSEYKSEIASLLNDFEWFAMSCQYGLADEEMLYQSLQTTFISHVWLMYYFIASRNIRGEDKLYTNVIWLFNTWKDRLHSIQSQAEDLAKKVEAERKSQQAKAVFTGKTLK